MDANLNKIKSIVKLKLELEPTGHDYLHALRVSKNAQEISKGMSVDFDVIYASTLVHDLIDYKLDDKFKLSESEVRKLLIESNLSENQTSHILEIISSISFSKGTTPQTLEGKIVQDADRLDALGAIGIARTFAFGGKHHRKIYSLDKEDRLTSIAHFYDKLLKLTDLMNTEIGKKEAINRTKYMEEFLNTFILETGGE